MTWIIIIAVAIVFFLFYNSYKGMKDIKYVEKSGGLRIKYQELIDFILTNEKLKLKQNNSNNIEIGYSFIGNGHVKFKLTEMSRNLSIRYQSKDNVNGNQTLAWKFNEFESQQSMFETITKDILINNFKLEGLSSSDALEVYSNLNNEEGNKHEKRENVNSFEKEMDMKEFNDCIGSILELYNELTEKIRTNIGEEDILNDNEKILLNSDLENGNLNAIKQHFIKLNNEGRFDSIVTDFLLQYSDFDYIIYKILHLSKQRLKIPNHLLVKLESSEATFLSFIQSDFDEKIRLKLFTINSVQDTKDFLCDLISTSEKKLILHISL